MMDDVIEQTIYLIDNIIESDSYTSMISTKYPHLHVFRNNLDKLLEKDPLKDDFTRLFSRRLKRLMNYEENDIDRQCEFWTDIHGDLLYALYGPSVREDKQNWERYLARMELEGKLEKRESQFQMIVGSRRVFLKLLWIHRMVVDEYLQKCISFHSKVQVRNLIEKIDDLLYCTYQQTEIFLTAESRVRLEEKLKYIEIDFDCSEVFALESNAETYLYEKFEKITNNNIDSFLPTVINRKVIHDVINETGITALRIYRWTVILGDPQCGKTTLVRWMTRVYAEAALRGDDKDFFRIPILIRIVEFAEWLKQHPHSTLMDYIGKHTWFSQSYTCDDIGYVLREFIYNGHALILVDGLNEIASFTERCKIINLVKIFIDDYIHAPDFLSPFDNILFENESLPGWNRITFDSAMKPPSVSIGNQIILTSRIVGYDLCSLNSPCIRHFYLKGMEWKRAVEFANQWIKQVEQSIRTILLDEGIQLNEIKQEILINRLDNIMNVIHISDTDEITSHMITLFCMHIFTFPDNCAPKSPIEVYSYGVQSILRTWASLQSNISEGMLTEFFGELSIYIYLRSLSDLVDKFDMEKLCSIVLKRLKVSNNRQELQEYTNKILSLLNSNISIVVEQGLEVFSFIHISLQRYFIVQALIRESSIEDVVRRFFRFINERRFHELLLMAIGWISWKWSLNNYNEFCDQLISYRTECILPLGSLLFFDALKYIHNLPSKEIIFKAFNYLLDHPSKLISLKYLTSSQLHVELIVEWMQLNITNEKRLFKFCLCLLHKECELYFTSTENSLEKISPRLFQQLWSLSSISPMAELAIDQTLCEIMKFSEIPNHIFENQLYSYLLSQNSSFFHIHPLIFSIILALCGGLHFTCEQNCTKVRFSPKTMHRQSSLIEPLMEYLINNQESHPTKVQILIKKYENILENSSPKDISSGIIDTFIAFMCLRGVSNPSIYDKFAEYDALPLVLLKFKQILLHLKEWYHRCHSIPMCECSFVFEMESIIKEYFHQSNHSNEQLLEFSFACIGAWKKLGLRCLSYFINFDVIQKSNINQDLEVQFEYRHYLTSQQQQQQQHVVERTEYTPFDLLLFLPQSLQQLFYRLFISSSDQDESLPLIVFVSECLMRLDNIQHYKTNHYRALSLLYPLCKEHKLENYCFVLFWDDKSNNVNEKYRKEFFQQVKNHELTDRFSTDVSENWKLLIDQERERINVTVLDQNKKDLHLFGVCLSLARLFQARYRSFKDQHLQENISISTIESEEIYLGIENIGNPILQLIILNMILRLNKPLIFTDEQIIRLNRKIIVFLNNSLSNFSLLLSTYFFIEYYEKLLQSCPHLFQQFVKIIGQKLTEDSIKKENQESTYVALRMLNDINLSYYLSKFEKQTSNLSNLLHFNSTIFFDYSSNHSLFNSSDTTLLSSMYLIELSTDIQILQMYTNTNLSKKTLSFEEEFDQLWIDPLKYKQIMTIEVANWITNYLKSSNREHIDGIIERISSCCFVEETAYKIISTWYEYRTDEHLKFFAYYAALFCNSMDILNEMFKTHNYLHLKTIIKSRLELEVVTSPILLNKLMSIIQGAYRISMHTSAHICSIEILNLLLEMERKRIFSNKNKSFLSVIDSCSENLQHYLIQHLQDFHKQNELENIIKEQYLIAIIKWMIREPINENLSIEVYDCLITFLHNQQIPRVQTMIANSINEILVNKKVNQGHVFIRDDLKKQLEDIIDKTNIDGEDLLAACLLAYGNCLLKFNSLEMDQTVSIEIQNLLERISLELSSEIISVRAFLCLRFSKNGNDKFRCSSKWIENNLNLPVQKRYNVLLQLVLYKHSSLNYLVDNEIINYIQTYSSILLDKFLLEVYNTLCNKDIFSGYVFDYVLISWVIFSSKSDMFLNALHKTSFDEQKFKTALCQASKATGDILYLNFYASFGEITNEFVKILTNVGEKYQSESASLKSYFPKIKNVSGRDVIENLFELFQLKFRSKSTFSIQVLELLVYLAQEGFISALDVHHQVSIVTNNGSYEYDETIFNNDNDPFFCLMKFRKFEGIKDQSEEIRVLTRENIEKNFKKNIQRTDKNPGLLFEERPFTFDV